MSSSGISRSLSLHALQLLETAMADECVNIEHEEVFGESIEPITKRRRMSGDAGSCTKQASKRSYGKKRKYQGNQHTKIAKRKQTTPVSERKVKRIYKQEMTGHVEGYRLIDMGLVQCLVSSLACPECHEKALVLEGDGCKKKVLSILLLCCVQNVITSSAVIRQKLFNH